MIGILQNGINQQTIIFIIAFLLAITLSITIHEFAHGYVAYLQGDDTAKLSGRLTLNPLAHLDLLGFLTLAIFGFGWAKPVPVNALKFKEYRKGIFLTSVAGIVANIFLAFFSAGLFVALASINLVGASEVIVFIVNFFVLFFELMATINITLAIFNLIPITPLDGFRLLCSITKQNNKFIQFINRYGSLLLIAVIIILDLTNILGIVEWYVLKPFIEFWEWVIWYARF